MNINIAAGATLSNVFSGAGAIGLDGGAIILTGNNTATGTLTITSGSLQIGNGGATGSYAGRIEAGANTVTFDRSDALTHSGVIAGIGAQVVQNGSGALSLSGNNTYTGGTQINAGSVVVGHNNALGTGTATVNTSGTLDVNGRSVANAISLNGGSLVNNSATAATASNVALGGNSTVGGSGQLTISNNMGAGAHTLTKIGTGTTIFTANNSSTGTTNVNAGTLQLGNNTAAGSVGGAIAVASGATLAVDRTGNPTMSNNISGAGTVDVRRSMTYTGNNTAANTNVATGATFTVGDGGTTGSVTGNIANSGNVTFNRSDTASYGGVISGTGSVTKLGGNTLTLTGNNTYGGTTNVNAGTLQLGNGGAAGSVGGAIAVASGATLAVDRTGNPAISNNISGAGTVDVRRSMTYTGNNTAANTNVATGATFTVGDGGANGSVTGNIANSGSVTFNRSGTVTYDGVISGASGSMTQAGPGTLILTANQTYGGATNVNAGTLQLGNGTGATGNVGGAIAVGTGATLAVNRTGNLTNNVSGAGAVDVLQDITFTGSHTHTGGTSVAANRTLTGALPTNGNLTLADNAKYNLGGADRAIGVLINTATSEVVLNNGHALTIGGSSELLGDITGTGNLNLKADMVVEQGARIATSGTTTVGNGATLDVTAAQDATEAAFQGGSLNIASDGTLRTTFADDYTLAAGEQIQVFIGNDMADFTADSGSVVIYVPNILYNVVDDWAFDGGRLYYTLKRDAGGELFQNISPQIGPVIDAYTGGNAFFDNLMTSGDTNAVEKAIQSGFDMTNLAAPMSALYGTWGGVNNAISNRLQSVQPQTNLMVRGQSCSPCGSTCGTRPGSREAWIAPIYGNARGFGLMSGNFRHGFVNDQYAIGFGIDQGQGGTRFGIMGLGGWGKTHSTGVLAKTRNETSFGGAYAYSNTHLGNMDIQLTAGWVGMNNDVRQATIGGDLTGKMNSGLASASATLTQTYRFGGLNVLPSFGVEYGYYYQGGMDLKWNGATAFNVEKARANLVALPIGAKFTHNLQTANGGWLTPEFRARYIANVGDVSSSYNVWLPGSPTSALMATRAADRHAGDIGLGVGFTRGWRTIRGDYGYMFSQHHQNQYASLSASWKF
ncbi:MAG: autotransporter-associated beta strand repeat-containing protein [Planctomycetaceae bacterium]|nr:autotransporter-associated beta strand repeat-containing protein [Planctomycetaceae bacterium]